MILSRSRDQERAAYKAQHQRRVLCVFPRYANSFGTFQYAYPLLPGVVAFMPPQGILLIAAYLPRTWDVRFVDENRGEVSNADLEWADVVFISGMHVQRPRIDRINERAHAHGKLTVLGGPSVSGCPAYYPDVDLLHLGELGDATDALIQRLDQTIDRPGKQLVFETGERLPMTDMPQPAYHLLDMEKYFLGSIQFSSGCPFLCEFCDIPALYGRKPRLKTPEQITAELDTMLAAGLRNAVYFVDDNFIANVSAARELLPHLLQWQHDNGFPINFCCEATLNLAGYDDILELMRDARFTTVFCGIETPEPEALEQMRKTQNMRSPILESVDKLNQYGIEVVSGIILGLDSDTPDTADHILEFIERSGIPMLTINMLYALPKTPLYARLEAEGRLVDDPSRASNVDFKMPYDQVLAMWRDVIARAYDPEALFERFREQTERCFPNRLDPPRKVTGKLIRYGLSVIARTLWRAGVRSPDRRAFWKTCLPLIRQGRIEDVTHIGIVTYHLLHFARDCATDNAEASFYNDPNRGVRSSFMPQRDNGIKVGRAHRGV